MEKSVLIKGDNYDISGIFSYTESTVYKGLHRVTV